MTGQWHSVLRKKILKKINKFSLHLFIFKPFFTFFALHSTPVQSWIFFLHLSLISQFIHLLQAAIKVMAAQFMQHQQHQHHIIRKVHQVSENLLCAALMFSVQSVDFWLWMNMSQRWRREFELCIPFIPGYCNAHWSERESFPSKGFRSQTKIYERTHIDKCI